MPTVTIFPGQNLYKNTEVLRQLCKITWEILQDPENIMLYDVYADIQEENGINSIRITKEFSSNNIIKLNDDISGIFHRGLLEKLYFKTEGSFSENYKLFIIHPIRECYVKIVTSFNIVDSTTGIKYINLYRKEIING